MRILPEVLIVRHAAVIVVGLVLAASSLADEPVDKLIKQLGSPDPKARAAARKALGTLGPEALPALRKALTHPDLEIRKRIEEVVPALETAVMVAPKTVSLNMQKKTAREIIQELAKQTGYQIDVWNDDPREVFTIKMEKVPFWKAADEVCRLSGVAPLVGYGDDRLRFQKQNAVLGYVVHDSAFRVAATGFQHNRTVEFRRPNDQAPRRSDTLTLNYTVHAEPKLPLLGAGEAQIYEAIDSEGGLMLPPAPPVEDGPAPPFGIARRQVARFGNGYASVSVQGSIALGVPSPQARGIKLLRVGIPVTVLVEQKPEVVTDKIMEAKNKKCVVGSTTFNIQSCELTPEKQYRVKMSVTEGSIEGNDYSWTNTLYRRVELLDEKGNKLQVFGSSWSHSTPNHVDVTFNYGMPGGKLEPPRKMTYQVWKTMSYQVKAEWHDLPLP